MASPTIWNVLRQTTSVMDGATCPKRTRHGSSSSSVQLKLHVVNTPERTPNAFEVFEPVNGGLRVVVQ